MSNLTNHCKLNIVPALVNWISLAVCNKQYSASSIGGVFKQQTVRLQYILISAISIGYLSFFAASALAKSASPDIRDLIEAQVVGTTQYPFGWTLVGDCSSTESLVICSKIKNKNREGVVAIRRVHQPNKPGDKVPGTITDAIALKRPNNYESFSFYCYPLDADPKAVKGYSIFAEVRFPKHCDVTTKIIQRAWSMNLDTGKFEKINNTKHLICEYGYALRGEPEFRSGCPGYSPIPSK